MSNKLAALLRSVSTVSERLWPLRNPRGFFSESFGNPRVQPPLSKLGIGGQQIGLLGRRVAGSGKGIETT
jgi:hypothetical protein